MKTFPIVINWSGWQSPERAFVMCLKSVKAIIYLFLLLNFIFYEKYFFLPMFYSYYQKAMSAGYTNWFNIWYLIFYVLAFSSCGLCYKIWMSVYKFDVLAVSYTAVCCLLLHGDAPSVGYLPQRLLCIYQNFRAGHLSNACYLTVLVLIMNLPYWPL